MSFAYPVVLDLAGRACLVVGGGRVAERKVDGLLAAGARVTVVSPWLTDDLVALAQEGRLQWRPREYAPGDAAGFVLVVVATAEASVSEQVAAECRERGIWINCADAPGHCDFILPSVFRRGALTVAVSTGGAGHGDRGADARHYLHRHARQGARQHLLAAPAEDERIAALQPHDEPAGLSVVDQDGRDGRLVEAMASRGFPGKDPERAGGSLVEEVWAHELIVDDHLRAPKPAQPPEGDQLRVAGSGADEDDAAVRHRAAP